MSTALATVEHATDPGVRRIRRRRPRIGAFDLSRLGPVFRELTQVPRLDPRQTAERVRLVQDWEAGRLAPQRCGEAEQALADLVLANLSFVEAATRSLASPTPQDRDDVLHLGVLGLLVAIRRFDPARGTSLQGYASWWVRQRVCERAEARPAVTAVSLDQPRKRGRRPLGRSLATDPAQGVEARAIEADRVARLDALVGRLKPKEQYVIRRRFGLDGAGGATLEETGLELNLSRERVRQLETRALERLGRNRVCKQLASEAA